MREMITLQAFVNLYITPRLRAGSAIEGIEVKDGTLYYADYDNSFVLSAYEGVLDFSIQQR